MSFRILDFGIFGGARLGILWLGEGGRSELWNVEVGLGEFGERIPSKRILSQEGILSKGILYP